MIGKSTIASFLLGRHDGRRSAARPLLLATLAVVVVIAAAAFLILRSRKPAPDLSLQRVQQAGVLVVGLDPSYPPFEVDDGHGHLAGFDVDLSTDLARGLGVQVRFVTIDFGSIFDALEVGKFDAIVGGVSPSSDYVKTIDYSLPYYDDGLVLIENPDVTPRTLGIESGSDADLDQETLRPELPGYTFQQFDDQSEIQADLGQRKLRGAIVDAVTAEVWAHQTPGLVVRPRRLTTSPFVFAVRRGDQKLLRAIDVQIAALQANGRVSELETDWFKG
ncbi:MAG TPA: ABC transporter substrate-binding protein [Chloroflexota bacterium]|nr:ABC transporter substrate-binding protein [Chloroflexota bacterium]